MQRGTKYVGMDVHPEVTAVTVRNARGKVILRTPVPTTEEAFRELFGSLPGSVHVAFEEGPQAQWLHDLLEPLVDRVVVANMRGQGRAGNKGDRLDSDRLSELLRRGGLRPVYHGRSDRATLRAYVRTYDDLVKGCTRVMNQIKATYRERGIRVRGQQVYHAAGREAWLGKVSDPGVRFRLEVLYGQLDGLRVARRAAKKAMVAEARRDPGWEVLTSIPFLGPVRTSQLLAVLRTPHRFRTRKGLWAYGGLAVVHVDSAEMRLGPDGRPVRRGGRPKTRGLNRNCNRKVKKILKAAARDAASRTGPLQDWYQERVERGLEEEIARVTLARKIGAVALRLWKKGERFDPTKLNVQAD